MPKKPRLLTKDEAEKVKHLFEKQEAIEGKKKIASQSA